MKKSFFLTEQKMEKMSLLMLPLVTLSFSLISGLWWLSDDLFQGVIGLFILTAFVIDYYIRTSRHGENKKYYCIVFILPWLISLILFTYGFLR